jgi:hypothetical protein
MKVRFTSVGDEILQPLFFTSQSLHPRVVFLTFSMCVFMRRLIFGGKFADHRFLKTKNI